MLLTRMVAERFGRLQSVTLGDLGAGLNIVLGPNEAGKSSFTTLVRYVLYGFPSKRGAEPAYESSAGKRLGRLVFEDPAGAWAIERVEGAHGGPIAVHALSGPDRPELDKIVTSGITRDAFRVVFGFGLGEMAEIESGRGAGLDILSRLYAAQAGLSVSPADVRQAIASEAGGLWLKSGQNPKLNAIKAQVAACKRQIAELEAQASEFAREREHLLVLSQTLEEVRQRRDQSIARAAELTAAVQELEDLHARIDESQDQITASEADLDAARDAFSKISVDERILPVAAELSAVLEDLSAFKQRLERIAALESQIAEIRRRATAALAVAGADTSAALGSDLGPETIAGLERWKRTLTGLESQSLTSARAADSAADAASSAAGPSVSGVPGRSSWAPGAVMAGLGAAVCGWGILSADYVQSVLGLLVLGVGVVFLVRGRSISRPAADREVMLAAAGAARTAADRDAGALESARGEWRGWLAARGLDGQGDDPAAVSMLVDAFRDFRSLASQADGLALERDAELQACQAYRDRLVTTAGSLAPGLAEGPLDEIGAHAARLRDAVESAAAADRERKELTTQIERAERSIHEAGERVVAIRGKGEALLASMGLVGADATQLKAEQVLSAQAATQASQAYEEALTEHARLSTRLDAEGADSRMAESRLTLAGLEARRGAALDRYAVLAVAERLLARTQSYNEQARQPAVVKRASELFETITAGRYVRVAVPPEGGEFVVYDREARPLPSSQLSTGAAQQLYLAVRIALIETLDEQGPGLPVLMDDVLVNFDPERKLGAARAVAELAAHRQVVVFTCHPETAGLFNEVAPEHTVVTLDRCD